MTFSSSDEKNPNDPRIAANYEFDQSANKEANCLRSLRYAISQIRLISQTFAESLLMPLILYSSRGFK
ncbi:MAG: hypothetical protein MHMPM18_004381 [Marteilia pararefringens]